MTEHYFNNFTNEELIEVLQRKDEWSQFDVDLAKQMLTKRGVNLSEDELQKLNKKREVELSQHDKPDGWYIPAGYIFCILSGWFGFAIGLSLVFATKEIPDGSKIKKFDPRSRSHGKIMLLAGVLSGIGWIWLMENRIL